MSLSQSDIIHVMWALAVLLISAHAFGYLFQRFRLPQVIGEITGGLVLGPSFLKHFWPEASNFLFFSNQPTQVVLGTIYHLGLLLLMFCSGLEMRSDFPKSERRTSLFISVFGTVIPFAVSLVWLKFYDASGLFGDANHSTAFTLIFASSVAITSIPVISRILLDLGILDTAFSRIVISSAVIEDVFLYIVVSISLFLVGGKHAELYGLPNLLGLGPDSTLGCAYYAVATVLFFFVVVGLGPTLFQRLLNWRYNLVVKRSLLGFLLIWMFSIAGLATFLGIAPMLGAFVAGIIAKGAIQPGDRPKKSIRDFSFGFFVPLYFALVGLRLDLIQSFYPLFFLAFLIGACVVKILSIYIGAKLAGEKNHSALHFGVAMNARGGPGIVLASLAYDARIINQGFYVSLIMLAIVTSLLAGWWLGFWKSRGKAFR